MVRGKKLKGIVGCGNKGYFNGGINENKTV